jgi:hypothetical protein
VHSVALLAESFDLYLARADIVLKLINLEVKHELKFLKLLNVLL